MQHLLVEKSEGLQLSLQTLKTLCDAVSSFEFP